MSTYNNTEENYNDAEMRISPKDADISHLTSAIVNLGSNINTYLMQVFKDAHNKGLRSGYVIGHGHGIEQGKKEGLMIGKKEGYLKGKYEGKMEIKKEYSNFLETEDSYSADMYVPAHQDPNIPAGHSGNFMALHFQQ